MLLPNQGRELLDQQREDGTPMGECPEQDEDVPDDMIVGAIVVGEKIGACCVGDTLCQKEQHRNRSQESYHWFCYEEDAPPHDQINGQRESRPTSNSKDFIEGSTYYSHPLQSKHQPTEPATHHTDEDGRIGAGYHDVDADMVALTQGLLQAFPMHPVIDGTAKEHEKHAKQEADNPKHHLPTDIGCQPNQPNGA